MSNLKTPNRKNFAIENFCTQCVQIKTLHNESIQLENIHCQIMCVCVMTTRVHIAGVLCLFCCEGDLITEIEPPPPPPPLPPPVHTCDDDTSSTGDPGSVITCFVYLTT